MDRHEGEGQLEERQAGQEDCNGSEGGSMLLDYERQMVEGLVMEDGLCIMSSGMGWQKVGGQRAWGGQDSRCSRLIRNS